MEGLYGDDVDKFLEHSPNKVVYVGLSEACDMSCNATIKFDDVFHLDIELPFGMCQDDEIELGIDKAMKYIFEKVCECLGVVVEYA